MKKKFPIDFSFKNIPPSKWVLLLIAVVYGVSIFQYSALRSNVRVGGDPWGYYAYLPALFIYDDIETLENTILNRWKYNGGIEKNKHKLKRVGEVQHLEDGNRVVKYTSGIAYFYAPFFAVAHLYCHLHPAYEADGYAKPYVSLIGVSAFFYVLLGLFFLRKTLLHYFDEKTTAVVLFAIALATNLYYFTTYNSAMSHAYLFALYSVLLYCIIQFYQNFAWKYAIGIGVCAGWITLIRPVEIIVLFLPLLYGLGTKQAWKERLGLYQKHYKAFLLAVVAAILVGLPQLIYWKYVSGDWLFYSYGNEGFDFSKPRIWDGLFSFQNGWFAYTPLMFLATAGTLWLLKYRDWLLPFALFFTFQIYIAYSWWCWYYINGFGSRPMVETYAMVSIALGYLVAMCMQKTFTKYLLIGAIACLTWLNIFQTYQFYKSM